MDDQHDVLEHRHGSSTVHVSKVYDESDTPDHECTLPICRLIRLLVHKDKSLNHGSDEEGTRSSASLPAHCGHPASKVAEQLLMVWRSKL